MRALRAVALVAGVFLSLASATPYQQMGWRGGYEERRLGAGRFWVRVKVNARAGRGRALEYLHRRAEELCAADGFAAYAIEDSTSGGSTALVPVGNTLHAVDKPELAAIVRCR